jgi:hypothetical protein
MHRHIAQVFFLTLVVTSGIAMPAAAQATPIGFAETWALATDRGKALEQLIPGTPDYYYYYCRLHQDTGAFDKVEPLLRAWIQRHGRRARVEQIENRQALLTFDKDPAKTLAFLQQRLGLRFDHQRQMSGAKQNLPTRLDPALVSSAAFRRRAMQRHPRTVAGFRESAFESLLAGDLSDDLLMSLLGRLQRPDVANLPALIVRNLRHRRSQGFGSLPIHKRLLLAQLEECVRLRPPLLKERNFIDVYLRRLRPGADVRWQRDAKAREAYLERLHAFASRLAPAQNSLKAYALHHRLRHDLAAGKPNKARLMAYLRLPRTSAYVNPDFLRRHRRSGEVVDSNRGFPCGFPPIGNDEKLVRTYLMHFFASEDSFQSYTDVVRVEYLRRTFAETKILKGVGDMERWYSMLDDPSYYEALKERVEIEFAVTQRKYFGANEAVSIDVDVKNVQKLLVKVFEINTLNYYQNERREVDASINLDGLVANHETTNEYTDSPLRRVRRRFDLGAVSRPGVYVVELIGNGLSSRAVIHKGRLQFTERLGAAGHVFIVRDGAGKKLPDAVIWFGGKNYVAGKNGEIGLPYSTSPGQRTMILRHGELSSLARFRHSAESYRLVAGIHLDRESLLSRRRARILIRPTLQLNGRSISLDVLEDAVLTIRSRDRDGVESSLEVRDMKLFADKEAVHEIQVPAALASLSVSLRGRVRSLSRGKTTDIASTTRTFTVNAIDATAETSCPLLGRTEKGYVLDVLGKNGEPKSSRPVRLTISHRDYSDVYVVTLKTDARGRIVLGALDGIIHVQASGLPRSSSRWDLRSTTRTYPVELHGLVGQILRVPYLGVERVTSRAAVSLLETRDGAFVRDAFEHVALTGGFVELRDLPAGDYSLLLKESARSITVRVTKGVARSGWAVGEDRLLEMSDTKPMHITAVSTDKDGVRVQLANPGAETRVHVVATRYLTPFDAFTDLIGPSSVGAGAMAIEHPESSYHSGRKIGDEYRYILDRRFAKKYPGNMLKRPGLILNPWALDDEAWYTAVGLGGGAGGKFGGRRGGRAGGPSSRRRSGGSAGSRPGTFANLEFLPEPAVLVANLKPDAAGVVQVAFADLGAGQLVHVVAVDGKDTVYASVVRDEKPLVARGRQLRRALDAKRHFSEQRRIEFLAKGDRAVLEDVATAKAETYDSLTSVYRLFSTLSGSDDLSKFSFVLRWPDLTMKEKRAFYEDYACHELHLFVHEKDPRFFKDIVRPHLANKMHKTFMDHWLLGDELKGYVEPWRFGRLNVVERILLARRLESESGSVRRHVDELFDVKPRDAARLARLFRSALRGQSLEGNADGIGNKLADVRDKMRRNYAPKPSADPRERARGDRKAGRPGRPEKKSKSRNELAKGLARESRKLLEVAEEEVEEESLEEDDADANKKKADFLRRKDANELYRSPDPTRAHVEHNYWHRRNHEHVAQLIQVNGFWRDFALAPADQPFLSTHVTEATNSFAEMMMALAILDLPFASGKHISKIEGGRLTMDAGSSLLLVRKELVETKVGAADKTAPVLVSQNYYRLDEPYRFEGNQRFDAYVTGEFLVDVAYGCRVVVTNPTSSPRKLDLLMQIPQGAIPVKGGFYTKGVAVSLAAYATSSFEYAFYFPAPGTLPHYPVHVARDGNLVAFEAPRELLVVPEPSKIDKTSWQYVSQNGTNAQVLSYIDGTNLQRTDLNKVAWRMRDREMFTGVVNRLRKRKVYSDVLWSYGIKHRAVAVVREYLRHQDRLIARCGAQLESPLLTIDPIERHAYQHIEYEPLFNERAHRFGKQRGILNHHLAGQYLSYLRVLGDKKKLDDVDWMSVTYYLILQDRVEEALATFARVRPETLPMRVQYDYMQAYLDFFTAGTSVAASIADRYKDHPVLRWRKLFGDIRNQIDEANGESIAQSDRESRTQRQNALAASEPALELEVEAQRVTLRYKNVEKVEVRYYEMDVEFLFSTHPFVQQGAGSFAYIKPNRSETRTLDKDRLDLAFDLPRAFRNSNVLIEVRAGGITRRKAYYANSIAVQWVENYGQLKVTHKKTGKPLSTVYVKVFARMPGGKVRFYKDGYTDLRGRFDYASLSAKGARGAQRYALLVLSEDHGAVIREVAPPAQ